jgi:hypothetical protein
MSIKLYEWFSDKNNDVLTFTCQGQQHLNVTINQETGYVTLIPESDWNGKEQLRFTASDGMFNISDSIVINVIGVNDAPDSPVIISPKNGAEVTEGDKILLSAICTDPDLPYGDKLFLTWSSDIAGYLGEGNNISGIVLPAGSHVITLVVHDRDGIQATSMTYITVREKSGSERFLENTAAVASLIAVIIIVIAVIFVLFTMLRKKREKEEKADIGEVIQPEIVEPEEASALQPSPAVTTEPGSTLTITPEQISVITPPQPPDQDAQQEMPAAAQAAPSSTVHQVQQSLPPLGQEPHEPVEGMVEDLPLTKPVDSDSAEAGSIPVIIGEKVEPSTEEPEEATLIKTEVEPETESSREMDTLDQLEKLGELHEKGLLNDDDFQKMKEKLLNR